MVWRPAKKLTGLHLHHAIHWRGINWSRVLIAGCEQVFQYENSESCPRARLTVLTVPSGQSAQTALRARDVIDSRCTLSTLDHGSCQASQINTAHDGQLLALLDNGNTYCPLVLHW